MQKLIECRPLHYISWSMLLLLAFLSSVSKYCTADNSYQISARLIVYTCIIAFILIILFEILVAAVSYLPQASHTSNSKRTICKHDKYKEIALFALLILLCWLPYLIALYPGIVYSDTSGQLCQFFGNPPEYGPYCIEPGSLFSDHHPIFCTIIFGSLVQIGVAFNSPNAGFFVLVALQSLFMALSISYSIWKMKQWGVHKLVRRLALFFYALFPLFPFLAASPTKDTLFSTVFLLYICWSIDAARNGLRNLSKKDILMLALLAMLLVLTKKTGAYVLLLTVIGLVIAHKGQSFRIALACLPALLTVFIVLPTLVFPIFKISPGSKNEMLGVLYQQSARYALDNPTDITPSEYAVLNSLFKYEELQYRYDASIVDYINHDSMRVINPDLHNVLSYLTVYIRQGIRHPESYVRAYLDLERGWFNLDQRYTAWMSYGMIQQPGNGIPNITRPDYMIPYAEKALSFANMLKEMPLVSLLFIPGIYTTYIPWLCLLALLTARSDHRELSFPSALPFVPLFASIPFLLISPVSDVANNAEALRYSLPFLYTAPLMLSFILSKKTLIHDKPSGRSMRCAQHVPD